MKETFLIQTLEDWDLCLDALEPLLRTGSVLALSGPLGAGKTTFVQRLAARLGAASVPKSPTFSLLRTYPLAHPALRRLLHVDAYRLENEAEMRVLNLEEELEESGTIVALEWPERIPLWLVGQAERAIWLTITPQEDGTREAVLEAQAPQPA